MSEGETAESSREPHPVISLSGWTCDICGRDVNGQTDDQGTPTIPGDSVRHLS